MEILCRGSNCFYKIQFMNIDIKLQNDWIIKMGTLFRDATLI